MIQSDAESMQVDHRIQPECNENREKGSYSVENPKLNIEAYAQSYTGLARLHRLIYIADHCPSLRMEALKMAIVYATSINDVTMYDLLHNRIANSNGDVGLSDAAAELNVQDIPPYDLTWATTRTKDAAQKLKKLEHDLKSYKSNSIKEDIRRSLKNLGDHHLSYGDLPNALKCYLQALDYCISGKDIVTMCLDVIEVSILLEIWTNVSTYVAMAVATLALNKGHNKDVNQLTFTKLKCAAGLADLAAGKYKAAAEHFLQASFDHCKFPNMISPNNVAMYGGLCALATFNHEEMHKHVISNNEFKSLLELEPKLHELILQMDVIDEESFLRMLDEVSEKLLLDSIIARHLKKLISLIQHRATSHSPSDSESGVINPCVLYIHGFNVSAFYGTVNVSLHEPINNLKSRIEEISKIPTIQQVLYHRGVRLNDSNTLDIAGIRTFDAIRLKIKEKETAEPKRKQSKMTAETEEEMWLQDFFVRRFNVH